jgi:hypothetical protein
LRTNPEAQEDAEGKCRGDRGGGVGERRDAGATRRHDMLGLVGDRRHCTRGDLVDTWSGTFRQGRCDLSQAE